MYVLFLSTYATEIANIYDDMNLIYEAGDVKKAVGTDLDLIGEKFNIPRPTAQKSSVELVFSLSKAISTDIVIPIGSEVETVNEEVFYTIEETVLVAGDTSTKCQAKSTMTGYNSRVVAGEINKILFNTYKDLKVNNPENSSGGCSACSDNEYRELIQKWAYSHNRGTKEAYELFFRYFEGLDGYKLIPLWDGTGTLKIVIDPGTDYMITTIKSLVAENVQLFDDDVLVVAATDKNVDVDATANVTIDSVYDYSQPEKDNIQLRIKNNIKIFIDGGYKTNGEYYTGLRLGEDFIPHKCSVFLDGQIPELKSINFTNENFVSISEEEKAVSGIINVTMD